MLEPSAIELQALVHSELEQNPVLEEVGPSSPDPVNTILPDIILEKVGSEYVVTINDGAIPQLRVSENYKSWMVQAGTSAEVRDYIREKTAAAKRLIESLAHRQKVLMAIGIEIAKFQRDFLENRCSRIMPMALPRVAVLAGLEETAASHSLSNKYIETPLGVFELARFFPQNPRRN
jgi:RNA polymerase sigma-54 factor